MIDLMLKFKWVSSQTVNYKLLFWTLNWNNLKWRLPSIQVRHVTCFLELVEAVRTVERNPKNLVSRRVQHNQTQEACEGDPGIESTVDRL